MRARVALLGLAVLAAGCGSGAPPRTASRTGPAGVARIGLAEVRWPLDPALAAGRDETQLARTLFATPLRLDAAGVLRPGLCSGAHSADFRVWDLRCRHAAAIAAELRRVASLRAAPSRWLFADAGRIAASGGELRIVLRHPWRRFPYALTAVAAAPPGVPGAFRVVSAAPGRIVAARPGLRLVFEQVEPHAAAVAFRRGRLDEAPVALGDIRAARLDPALAGTVRVRPLLGVDLVAFRPSGPGPLLRRIYWETADRQSYQALVPELTASAAYGLIPGASTHGDAAGSRTARRRAGLYPPGLTVGVADRPDLVYGADLATAQWRDFGLGATVVPGAARPRATFERVLAPYAAPEALLGQVLLGRYPGSPAARTFRRALSGAPLLAQADDELQRSAAVVPLAWVADARLVSPRLQGWRRDDLGSVDYAAVRAPAASPRR